VIIGFKSIVSVEELIIQEFRDLGIEELKEN
jgi:hypothetical protein